jgi:hypothetical protein
MSFARKDRPRDRYRKKAAPTTSTGGLRRAVSRHRRIAPSTRVLPAATRDALDRVLRSERVSSGTAVADTSFLQAIDRLVPAPMSE